MAKYIRGMRESLSVAFVGAWRLAALLLGIPAALYLPAAETWSARLVIGSVLLGLVAGVLVWRRRRGLAWVTGAWATGGVAVACVLASLARTPSGAPTMTATSGARLVSRFTSAHPYPRFAPANVVPEIDQFKFGSYLVPATDPFLTAASSARLRGLIVDVYRDMDRDPAFRALGSAMPYAYDDTDSGHVYAYVPAHAPAEKLGVLLFLHGSAGNFKVYTHLLQRVAEQEHVMVVAPSFGFGNWQNQGGTAAIAAAVGYAVRELDADPSRVVLMGLSNGGRGVTRALRDGEEPYAGVVFLSAVMETNVLQAVGERCRGMPALVLYGEADDRLPRDYEETGAEALRKAGLVVRVQAYPREDHFLFFSQKASIQDETAAFVRKTLMQQAARR
jgi:pimeloyl-ACP methyl ester carboxylesterase